MADWFSGVTYSFSPATVIASSELNQNFTDLKTAINSAMPTGGILIWSGAIADIPATWTLCNGSGGTPDLRNKFVIGAGSTYVVGDTGGASSVTLTTNELPAHTHGVTQDAEKWYGTRWATSYASSGPGTDVKIGFSSASISTQSAGSGAAFSILNPYYALAFIMKTS